MKKRVLIVDDEPDVVTFLAKNLESNEYQTISAFDGEEGLKKAIEEKPDLILLDLIMPRYDGWKMLKGLKAHQSTSPIPVIVVSAKAETDSIFAAKQQGVVDYLIKPVKIAALVKYIKRYIDIYPVA
jgi:DNA-binding response OmpR family regulator